MDDAIRQFLESVSRSRCYQRGIHTDFDAQLTTLKAALGLGLVECRIDSRPTGEGHFFHAWLTDAGHEQLTATKGNMHAGVFVPPAAIAESATTREA